MEHNESDQLIPYLNRLKPLLTVLFRMGLVITGDRAQAEYALEQAMLAGWNSGRRFRSSRAFRRELERQMALCAWETCEGQTEYPEAEDLFLGGEGDGVDRLLSRERPAMRRLILLYWGCGLRPDRIAGITGLSTGRVRRLIEQLRRRVRDSVSGTRSHTDRMITELCREELAKPVRLPDPSALLQALEAETEGQIGSGDGTRRAVRILSAVLAVLLVLILGAALYVTAVNLGGGEMPQTEGTDEQGANQREARQDLSSAEQDTGAGAED